MTKGPDSIVLMLSPDPAHGADSAMAKMRRDSWGEESEGPGSGEESSGYPGEEDDSDEPSAPAGSSELPALLDELEGLLARLRAAC